MKGLHGGRAAGCTMRPHVRPPQEEKQAVLGNGVVCIDESVTGVGAVSLLPTEGKFASANKRVTRTDLQSCVLKFFGA